MKTKLLLSLLIFIFSLGCKKDGIASRIATFNITNSSSLIIKETNIKLQNGIERIDAITLTNIEINKTETRVINLSTFNIKGDAGYIVIVTLSDDKKIEKRFGYITNGLDVNTRPYNIEISNDEIIIK